MGVTHIDPIPQMPLHQYWQNEKKWKISLSQKKLKTKKCELTGKVSKEKERILKKEFL